MDTNAYLNNKEMFLHGTKRGSTRTLPKVCGALTRRHSPRLRQF